MIIREIFTNYKIPFYFYHLLPKEADISLGLLSPYAMVKLGLDELANKSLDKYRERLVNEWDIIEADQPIH